MIESAQNKTKAKAISRAELNYAGKLPKQLSLRADVFSRQTKQLIALGVDIMFILFTVWMSFSLRYESLHYPEKLEWVVYILALLIAIPIFIRFGFYRSIYRYSGFTALSTVTKACILYGVLYAIAIRLLSKIGVPFSVGILQPILLLLAVGSSRAVARLWFHPGNADISNECVKENLLIYGAGSAGVQIASALQHDAHYNVDGFIDDDFILHGKSINGISVYCPDDLSVVIKKKGITSILIALPKVKRSRRQEIFSFLEDYGVHIRTLPDIKDIADGKISASDIRELDIEDLLGRDIVPPDAELIEKCIGAKKVLVTGAGGSIGSELCRQILALNPEILILLDQSEYNLYALNQELEQQIQKHGFSSRIVSLLGDVTDKRSMQSVFSNYRPHTVYHAAAYKHVPLVESNPVEGLRNNVMGTFTVAEVARKSGVSHMVLISTDKAVRPTNVMGASKRISELILQAMAAEHESGTCFSMVRFGNVLGSSGSVVPLFRSQIKNGGPVTVTHKEITRYFMTIPEAAQLVIQAGAMAVGGDVFLLDMGKPVKIIDLAKRMIELSGLTLKDQDNPEGDIDIAVTGLRPGEKLYEELLIADNPIPTAHPRIFKAHEYYYPMEKLMLFLDDLSCMLSDGNIEELKPMIKSIVDGYQFNGQVNGLYMADKESHANVL